MVNQRYPIYLPLVVKIIIIRVKIPTIMKITLYEFLALPDQEQYDIIFTAGEYLEIRIKEDRRFVLYAVDLFFVEWSMITKVIR